MVVSTLSLIIRNAGTACRFARLSRQARSISSARPLGAGGASGVRSRFLPAPVAARFLRSELRNGSNFLDLQPQRSVLFHEIRIAGARRLPKRNLLAVLLKNGLGQLHQSRPGQRAHHFFKRVARQLAARAKVGMHLPNRPAPRHPVERIQNLPRHCFFLIRGRAESLRDAAVRRAKIANPARFLPVSHIAKMPDQTRHAALAALRIPDHLLNLRPLLVALRDIRIAPVRAAEAHVVR